VVGLEGCSYGIVSGEVIITLKTMASTKDLGIDVKVNGATVRRDLFGMETWGKAIARIKGDEGSQAPAAKLKPKKRHNPLVKKITPNAIVRRMRMGNQVVSVCLDFFGENGPECFSEGNVVYINRDHPLFLRESRKTAAYTMYMARLITQEIALMKETKSPRLAFTRQSKLLKDAFAD